jgi:hypothetical protein
VVQGVALRAAASRTELALARAVVTARLQRVRRALTSPLAIAGLVLVGSLALPRRRKTEKARPRTADRVRRWTAGALWLLQMYRQFERGWQAGKAPGLWPSAGQQGGRPP